MAIWEQKLAARSYGRRYWEIKSGDLITSQVHRCSRPDLHVPSPLRASLFAHNLPDPAKERVWLTAQVISQSKWVIRCVCGKIRRLYRRRRIDNNLPRVSSSFFHVQDPSKCGLLLLLLGILPSMRPVPSPAADLLWASINKVVLLQYGPSSLFLSTPFLPASTRASCFSATPARVTSPRPVHWIYADSIITVLPYLLAPLTA